MDAKMYQNDMQLKYTWQARHCKRNHANRHHEQLIMIITKCNKTVMAKDCENQEIMAETVIILLYKQVKNYMQMNNNMT